MIKILQKESDKMKNRHHIPQIGNRIIKSSFSVLLCYVIYLLRGRGGIPFYSMLAALWCIQPYADKTLAMALQRTAGTFIGGSFGFLTIVLEIYVFPIYDTFAGYVLVAAMIIPVLYTTVVLNKKNASYFSCVVFLSITVIHITDSAPLLFVMDRVLDTFIGIAAGIAVNSAHLPRKRIKDRLFAAELDDMLSPVSQEMEPYSRVELNRMIDEGLKFTVVTMRTPASLLKPLSDVHMNMPVVVMNGAALYDIKENTYVKAYVISHDTCEKVRGIINSEGINCFTNALCDDSLMIYYDKLENEAEKSIYSTLKRSPHRNYVSRPAPSEDRVIYLMAVDRTDRIEALRRKLEENAETSLLKIISYPSDDYKGYSYIKIYNKNASKKNMIEYLVSEYSAGGVVMVGTHDGDSVHADGNSFNRIVKALKKSFEPISFAK